MLNIANSHLTYQTLFQQSGLMMTSHVKSESRIIVHLIKIGVVVCLHRCLRRIIVIYVVLLAAGTANSSLNVLCFQSECQM